MVASDILPPEVPGSVQQTVLTLRPDGVDPELGVTVAGRLDEGPPGVLRGPGPVVVLVGQSLPLLADLEAGHVGDGEAARSSPAGEAT